MLEILKHDKIWGTVCISVFLTAKFWEDTPPITPIFTLMCVVRMYARRRCSHSVRCVVKCIPSPSELSKQERGLFLARTCYIAPDLMAVLRQIRYAPTDRWRSTVHSHEYNGPKPTGGIRYELKTSKPVQPGTVKSTISQLRVRRVCGCAQRAFDSIVESPFKDKPIRVYRP